MLIEISVLPQTIQQQILSLPDGELIEFAKEGKVIKTFIYSKVFVADKVIDRLKDEKSDN